MQVSAFQLDQSYPYGGTTFELWLFYTRTWTDITGKVHVGSRRPGASEPHKVCPGTVSGTTGTVLSFEHSATMDSPDFPRVRVEGWIVDSNGRMRYRLFKGWQFPIDTDPITYKFLSVYNRGVVRRLADKYLNRDEIYALFSDFVGAILPASDVVLGSVVTDGSPADAALPRVVGVKESGFDVLVSGEPTTIIPVDPSLILANSPIEAVGAGDGVIGHLYATNRIVGTSFDVKSAEGADAGAFKWFLY